MKEPWFHQHKSGLPIVPVTWQGKAVVAWGVIVIILSLYLADADSGSVSDTLIGAFPFILSTGVIILAIMQVTGKQRGR